MQGLAEEGGEAAALCPEEEALKAEMDVQKTQYKQNFNMLRQLKSEIEHLQVGTRPI